MTMTTYFVTATGQAQSADARRKIFHYQIEDLAAGVDILNRTIFMTSAGGNTKITRVRVIHEQAAAGIAANPNDFVFTLKRSTGETIGTFTLTSSPGAGTINEPGSLTNANVPANIGLNINVTQNGTADVGRLSLEIEYENVT